MDNTRFYTLVVHNHNDCIARYELKVYNSSGYIGCVLSDDAGYILSYLDKYDVTNYAIEHCPPIDYK